MNSKQQQQKEVYKSPIHECYSNIENSSESNMHSPQPSRHSDIREQLLQFTPVQNGLIVDKDTYMKQYRQNNHNGTTASRKTQQLQQRQSSDQMPLQSVQNRSYSEVLPMNSRNKLDTINEESQDNQQTLVNYQYVPNLSEHQPDQTIVMYKNLPPEQPDQLQNQSSSSQNSDQQQEFYIVKNLSDEKANAPMFQLSQGSLDQSGHPLAVNLDSHFKPTLVQTMLDFIELVNGDDDFSEEIIYIRSKRDSELEIEDIFTRIVIFLIQNLFKSINKQDSRIIHSIIISVKGESQVSLKSNGENDIWKGRLVDLVGNMIHYKYSIVLRKICDIQLEPENSLINIIFDGEMQQNGQYKEYESEMMIKFEKNDRLFQIISWKIHESNNF